MNKKRLYKQSGMLHPRGLRAAVLVEDKIRELFAEYSRFHPRDIELLVIHAAHNVATEIVLHADRTPKTVKSV